MGFAKEKSLDKIMPLLPKKIHYIFTKANIDRARNIEDIATLATELGLSFETKPTVAEAIAHARSLAHAADTIFIGGSNFVVAEIDGITTPTEE